MRRPDRRRYIAEPTTRPSERRPERYRSRDSRDRRDHDKRSSTNYEKHERHDNQPVDMQLSYGSDDEEFERAHHGNRGRDHHHDQIRGPEERDAPLLPPEDEIRQGILFEYLNYYEFLRNFIDEYNRFLLEQNEAALPKRILETITPTTPAERERIILPEGVTERESLLHCDMIIRGFPPSVFFGSGFGHKPSLARAAAAKDLVDKCLRIGLISEDLHTSIANHPFFKKRELPRKDYNLAMDALANVDQKLSIVSKRAIRKATPREYDALGSWPWDLNTARGLKPETLEQLKAVFHSVVQDIYRPKPPDRAREELTCPPMPLNGAPTNSTDTRKREEFCRQCRQYGHSERHCHEGRDNRRDRGPARSPEPIREPRTIRHDERGPPDVVHERYSAVDRDPLHYSPMEKEQRIAQQREELLRQEMMLRRSEQGDSWTRNNVPPQPLQSQAPSMLHPRPLFAGVGVQGPIQPLIPPSVNPHSLEQPFRVASDEELRAKLEAKAQRLEEERLRRREEELERKMQMELELKKREMEEQIRRQVQLEERARLQAEFARAQQQALPPIAQPFSNFSVPNRYGAPYTAPPFSSPFAPSSIMPENGGANGTAYSSAPDFEMEEIKLLVKDVEDKLLDLQRNCRESELAAIFQSRAFRMIGELGDRAHMMDRSQKQNLLCELKELLNQAELKVKENHVSGRRRSRSRSIDREVRHRRSPDRRERRPSPRRSRSRSPGIRNTYKYGIKEDVPFKEIRVQVGGVTLRNLSPREQRHLKRGDVVVAQDPKTGKWTSSRLAKVSGFRATLSIGNTTWKKNLDELFKEVPEESF